jgi:hypothetical protein
LLHCKFTIHSLLCATWPAAASGPFESPKGLTTRADSQLWLDSYRPRSPSTTVAHSCPAHLLSKSVTNNDPLARSRWAWLLPSDTAVHTPPDTSPLTPRANITSAWGSALTISYTRPLARFHPSLLQRHRTHLPLNRGDRPTRFSEGNVAKNFKHIKMMRLENLLLVKIHFYHKYSHHFDVLKIFCNTTILSIPSARLRRYCAQSIFVPPGT